MLDGPACREYGRRVGRALVIVLLAGLLAAPAATGATDPWRTRTLAREGISVQLPAGWPALAQRDVVSPGTLSTLHVAYPDLFPLLVGLTSVDAPLRLLLFDPHARSGTTPTIGILVRTLPAGSPFARWTPAVLAAARSAPGLRGHVRATEVALPLGDALRLTYFRVPRGARAAILVDQLWVALGERLVTVSYSGPATGRAYETVLLRVARSLSARGARAAEPCAERSLSCA